MHPNAATVLVRVRDGTMYEFQTRHIREVGSALADIIMQASQLGEVK